MANRVKGEVAFPALGSVYTLKYSTDALAAAETALDMSVFALADLAADLTKMRITTLRALFHAGLRDHHPGLTVEDAGRVMDELGLPHALTLFSQAFVAAFPDAAGAPKKGKR